MKDIRQRLEKLLTDAEECELIGRLATNAAKRQTFMELAAAYKTMAHELEEMAASGDHTGDIPGTAP